MDSVVENETCRKRQNRHPWAFQERFNRRRAKGVDLELAASPTLPVGCRKLFDNLPQGRALLGAKFIIKLMMIMMMIIIRTFFSYPVCWSVCIYVKCPFHAQKERPSMTEEQNHQHKQHEEGNQE